LHLIFAEKRTAKNGCSTNFPKIVCYHRPLAGMGPAPKMKTILLLICANVFMTFAWYGHLRYRKATMISAILVSWGIAFFEYCLQVPANRIGYGEFSAFQLKIIQEVITLTVFTIFVFYYLGEGLKWNHAVSFLLLLGAAFFAFWGQL
jgi:uncharacterized protein (DUF486 family)